MIPNKYKRMIFSLIRNHYIGDEEEFLNTCKKISEELNDKDRFCLAASMSSCNFLHGKQQHD